MPFKVQELARHKVEMEHEVRRAVWKARETLNALHDQIENLQLQIQKELTWSDLSAFLLYEEPAIFEQLCFRPVDDDGFNIVGRDGKALREDFVWSLWSKGSGFPAKELPSLECRRHCHRFDIWSHPLHVRVALISSWCSIIAAPLRERLTRNFISYKSK